MIKDEIVHLLIYKYSRVPELHYNVFINLRKMFMLHDIYKILYELEDKL